MWHQLFYKKKHRHAIPFDITLETKYFTDKSLIFHLPENSNIQILVQSKTQRNCLQILKG